ncbi:MAG: glycosyltransferase family 2 protein [Prochloraceae cyanobacterium]|nr:glycosyltransferase family 2 protein [Prochloraceae cyanobacterium]
MQSTAQNFTTENAMLDLSVVVPIYNENDPQNPNTDPIGELIGKITDSLEGTGLTYELICIDDGSKDGSDLRLKELVQNYPQLITVLLRRNYGQTAAMAAGFEHAQGRTIVTLDGDLQNDPADIPQLLAKLDEGYDLVSGWRKKRKDAALTRLLPSKIANWLIGKITGVKMHDTGQMLHDYGCSLKAYRKEVVADMKLYGELHRFLPALAYIEGARITELPVNHYARPYGSSKYGLGRTTRVVLDLFTVFFLKKFLTRPMHVFGLLGIISITSGMFLGVYLTFVKLILNQSIGDRPLLILAVVLLLSGVQLFCFGLLGELLMRTYHESQGRPIYRVREVVRSRVKNC